MEKFEATFTSLRKYQCPQWFADAKFGIWSHWGPQSVPMAGDWYARNMYIQGTPQYRHHLRTYGHPSKFGYKDICKLWKAENFEPDYLMELYRKAGARYFCGQIAHHDNFINFPTKFNDMNSAKVGPMKDICGLWKKAAEKQGLPFGLGEHLGRSFAWMNVNKGCDAEGPYKGVRYDGWDENYQTFYHKNQEHMNLDMGIGPSRPQYTRNSQYHQYWMNVIKEAIDLYQPDLLYTDGGLPFGELFQADESDPMYQPGLEVVSYLYNTSIRKYGENRAVYTQKDWRDQIYTVGTYDIESSKLPDIFPTPWQTEICIGPWFYDSREPYLKPLELIETFVDILAKNGTLLLNIPQLPDGTLDEESVFFLQEIGKWFSVCAEGIYDTRPWRIFKEGVTVPHQETAAGKKMEWTETDFYFTSKSDDVFAFVMKVPSNGTVVLRSFAETPIECVSLLGGGLLEFEQKYGILTVKLPEKLPTEYINCLKIHLK
ncbi:MAG: alpha-L-fucosidase [Candidatus Merdivicinus sp.]|jgi:alpha-L-fucosidase